MQLRRLSDLREREQALLPKLAAMSDTVRQLVLEWLEVELDALVEEKVYRMGNEADSPDFLLRLATDLHAITQLRNELSARIASRELE